MATKQNRSVPVMSESDIERFWLKIDKRGPDECWPWKGYVGHNGSGCLRLQGDNFSPHRLVYYLKTGNREDLAARYCATARCCNPNHIGPFLPPKERLMALTEVQENGCWKFTGFIGNHGYGMLSIDGKEGSTHRLSYKIFKGQIPKGRIIDHKCHDPEKCHGGPTCPHRRCVNPEHLELSTHKENTSKERSCRSLGSYEWQAKGLAASLERRRLLTHCIRGHEFTPENTAISKRGQRGCKKCAKEYHEKHYVRKRSKTHCQRGHEWTPENTGKNNGKRFCIKCYKMKSAEYNQAKKTAKLM